MSDIRKDIEKIKQLLLKKSNCDCENSGSGGGNTTLMEQYLLQLIDLQTNLNVGILNKFIGQNVIAKGFTTVINNAGISVGDLIDLEYAGYVNTERIKSITIINEETSLDLFLIVDNALDVMILKPLQQYKWNGSNNGTFGYGFSGQSLYQMVFDFDTISLYPVTIYFEEISWLSEDGTQPALGEVAPSL